MVLRRYQVLFEPCGETYKGTACKAGEGQTTGFRKGSTDVAEGGRGRQSDLRIPSVMKWRT